ncbi:hypothetical protein JMJ28_004585 [Escherichia coli]|nr:hypothetical protein [Escherichia coli]
MNEHMIYVLNVDSSILQAYNKRITDIFMTKHKSGIVKYCGKDMERFQLFFEAALFAVAEWQIQVEAETIHCDEVEVMDFFERLDSYEAGKLAESILIFNDIIVMSSNEKVCTYFLR